MVDFSFLVHKTDDPLLTPLTHGTFWRHCGASGVLGSDVFLLKVAWCFSQTTYLRLGCVRCHVWVSKVVEMCTCAILVPSLPYLWLAEADIAVLRWQETSTAASSSPEASGRRPKGTVTVAVLLCYMSLHFNSLEYHCSLSLEDRISLKMKGLMPDKPGEIGSHVNHLPNL